MKYRPHREYFTDSMAEVLEFNTKEDFHKHLGTTFDKVTFGYQGYDKRCGWISYLVCVDGKAVGHSDCII